MPTRCPWILVSRRLGVVPTADNRGGLRSEVCGTHHSPGTWRRGRLMSAAGWVRRASCDCARPRVSNASCDGDDPDDLDPAVTEPGQDTTGARAPAARRAARRAMRRATMRPAVTRRATMRPAPSRPAAPARPPRRRASIRAEVPTRPRPTARPPRALPTRRAAAAAAAAARAAPPAGWCCSGWCCGGAGGEPAVSDADDMPRRTVALRRHRDIGVAVGAPVSCGKGRARGCCEVARGAAAA